MNTALFNANLIAFTDGSYKPSSSEAMLKLEKIITIFTSPYRDSHNWGGHLQQQVFGGYPMGYQPQMHPQMAQMQRRQQSQQPGGLHFSDNYTPAATAIVITIDVNKITVVIDDTSHFLTRDDTGAWTYTIDKSHYNEPTSRLVRLLCNEVLADCP